MCNAWYCLIFVLWIMIDDWSKSRQMSVWISSSDQWPMPHINTAFTPCLHSQRGRWLIQVCHTHQTNDHFTCTVIILTCLYLRGSSYVWDISGINISGVTAKLRGRGGQNGEKNGHLKFKNTLSNLKTNFIHSGKLCFHQGSLTPTLFSSNINLIKSVPF